MADGEALKNLLSRMEADYPDRIIVPGVGSAGARVVLIGEAPGENEEKQRCPFVGKAGKMLDEFLSLSGIARESLYITNSVKFRPTAEGKRGPVNRKPTKAEIDAFRPYLMRELEIIRPAYVVTLGNTPLSALTGQSITIGSVHGKVLELDGFRLYPMYHPASVIYNRSLNETYRRDVCALGELIRHDGY